MTELVVASQIKNTFLGTEMANWQRFEMAESARYVIQVSAANGDPLTRLYGPDEFALVVENDDDADSLNSEIQVWLEEGEYYLAVYNLSEDKVEFSILVTIVGDV